MTKIYSKKGMTIIEVIMALAIFTIGIVGFTELFVRSWQSNAFIMEEAQATRQAERALNGIVRDLREIRQGDDGGFAIKSAEKFDLVVFANVDEDEAIERVHYFLDTANDLLKKGVSDPVGIPAVYPVGDDSVVELSQYIVNTDVEPFCTYYDREENQLSEPVNLAEVSLIRVVLWINIRPVLAPENVRLESLVQIRNLGGNI